MSEFSYRHLIGLLLPHHNTARPQAKRPIAAQRGQARRLVVLLHGIQERRRPDTIKTKFQA